MVPIVYLHCLVSYQYFYQVTVRDTILFRSDMEKIFHFFLKRNVNYVQIKPCPFLASSPAASYKGGGTAKGPEHT